MIDEKHVGNAWPGSDRLPKIEELDYVVVRGDTYAVEQDHYTGDTYLRGIDDIPDYYRSRWEDSDE